MIIIPPDHAVIKDSIEKHLASKKKDVITVSWITDFDGTVYKLQSGTPEDPENRSWLCMSIQLAGFEGIASTNPEFMQQTCYAPYLRATEVNEGGRTFHATIAANLDTLEEGCAKQIAYDWACLKRNILGFPLTTAFEGLVDGSNVPPSSVICYRPEESIYVCPDSEKVTVVYALSYPDPNDMEIAKVFLEEFSVARRMKELQSSPIASFQTLPPGELAAYKIVPSDATVGYLSLTFEKRHVATPEKLNKATDMLLSVRSYLHYHIKCCKGYMHTRMRYRVKELLKVLNRADPTKAAEGGRIGRQ